MCPACSYKLVGEDKLIFKILVTMDSGDSLKRILCQEEAAIPSAVGDEEMAEPMLGPFCEPKDSRKVGGDYYIDRDQVNRWVKMVLEEMLPDSPSDMLFLFLYLQPY
jgi:hypothetical protein